MGGGLRWVQAGAASCKQTAECAVGMPARPCGALQAAPGLLPTRPLGPAPACLLCTHPPCPALPAWLAVAGLAADFTFTEIGGKARDVFKMFIS